VALHNDVLGNDSLIIVDPTAAKPRLSTVSQHMQSCPLQFKGANALNSSLMWSQMQAAAGPKAAVDAALDAAVWPSVILSGQQALACRNGE